MPDETTHATAKRAEPPADDSYPVETFLDAPGALAESVGQPVTRGAVAGAIALATSLDERGKRPKTWTRKEAVTAVKAFLKYEDPTAGTTQAEEAR
jgi:hypothetical protein